VIDYYIKISKCTSTAGSITAQKSLSLHIHAFPHRPSELLGQPSVRPLQQHLPDEDCKVTQEDRDWSLNDPTGWSMMIQHLQKGSIIFGSLDTIQYWKTFSWSTGVHIVPRGSLRACPAAVRVSICCDTPSLRARQTVSGNLWNYVLIMS
jgi:hypothetical protein